MNIMDAAHYLVYLSYHDKRNSLTPLKLQKLLYLAQGWSYVWDNRPLFLDEFEAWQYGPVNLEVYDYFKRYRRSEIPAFEGENPERQALIAGVKVTGITIYSTKEVKEAYNNLNITIIKENDTFKRFYISGKE